MTKELIIKDKQKYLEENYPFAGMPKLSQTSWNAYIAAKFLLLEITKFIKMKLALNIFAVQMQWNAMEL